MKNEIPLNEISIWTVWYEDRFAIGSDRDPASIVAMFLIKMEAESYIDTHEGVIDIQSGKFDGLFLKEWKASELIKSKIATDNDILRLSKMKSPAFLKFHWQDGWI